MDENIYRKYAYQMIYLTACAVNGKTPAVEKVDNIDYSLLFQVCERHVLTAATAYALEAIGIKNHEFTQAKEKAIRKNILLDAERARLLQRFESEQIWYMPLKGALLKDWYPKLGMRQMSDNDILCDPACRDRIRDIMPELGFTLEKNSRNVDEYFKQPVHNFEIHDSLFTQYKKEKIFEYYANIKSKLIKDSNHVYGYHFSHEDFYVYMTAHEYKHYKYGGTGVRSLLDVYIFIKKYGASIDMNYIQAELTKMGIVEFEQQTRKLAMKVFHLKKLSPDEKKLLDYYIFSGAYGTVNHAGRNTVEEGMKGAGISAKIKYVFHRLFPPMQFIKSEFPFFYKHKCLIPVLWLIRPIKGIIVNKKRIKAEIKYLFSYKS